MSLTACGQRKPIFQTVGGAAELIEAEGLEQVVDGIDLEALDSILGVGGREDDERRYRKRLHEIHAVEVGHVDVAEDGIDGLTVEDVLGLEGTLALGDELQKRNLADVCDELLQSQGLVVDG